MLISWWILAEERILPPVLLPSPTKVAETLLSLINGGELGSALYHTLIKAMLGFITGSIIGIATGLMMGISETAYEMLSPMIGTLYSLPGIVMIPLFMIWMGLSDSMIIVVSGIASFLNVALSTATGIRAIPKELINSAKAMGAQNLTLLLRIYLPLSAGDIFTGLKLGIEHSWRLTIAGEMLIGASGLGNTLMEAEGLLRMDILFATAIVIGMMGWAFERIISRIERRFKKECRLRLGT
ncbi:MAG: ABC transporter permease [Synergistetes bacterium]|nr:ABC transporter permease [Synergistota bacterium]